MGVYTILYAALGVIPRGPTPLLQRPDWTLFKAIPWDWVAWYLLDAALVCFAIDRCYKSIIRCRQARRLSLFWPLLLSGTSIGLGGILLLGTRRYPVGIFQELLAMGLWILCFLVLRFSWFSGPDKRGQE